MSVPSAIPATFAHSSHHSHYGFSHHSPYHNDAALYGSKTSLIHGSPRLPPAYSSSYPSHNTINTTTSTTTAATPAHSRTSPHPPLARPPPSSSTMALPQPRMTSQGSKRRDRRPDWYEFYKNGPPKEIIVIDDDSPPPTKHMDNERSNRPMGIHLGGEIASHPNKKRKTTQAFYEPVNYQPASYSTVRSDPDSGSGTISSDRTASQQTTAPTSLGSSNGSRGTYVEDNAVGQKRKRVTRQQVADERRWREMEIIGDAYSSYFPPPKPPIKAKDVHVPPVKDVSLLYLFTCLLSSEFCVRWLIDARP